MVGTALLLAGLLLAAVGLAWLSRRDRQHRERQPAGPARLDAPGYSLGPARVGATHEPWTAVGARRSTADRDLELARRRRELVALGLDLRRAAEAVAADVDTAELRRLVRCGCPLETALRILL